MWVIYEKVHNLPSREIIRELSHCICQTGEAVPETLWATLGKSGLCREQKN